MRKIIASTAMVAALAACSGAEETGSTDEGNISIAEAAQKMEDENGFRPEAGLYRVEITPEKTSVAGMSSDYLDQIVGGKVTREYCLTEEEANADPQAMLSKGGDGDCSYESFNVSGDQLDAVLVCKVEGGQMRMEQKGTVSSTATDLTVNSTMTLPGMGTVTNSSTVKHQRIGDCQG